MNGQGVPGDAQVYGQTDQDWTADPIARPPGRRTVRGPAGR